MEGNTGDFGVPSVDVTGASDVVRRAIRNIDANDAAEGNVLLADLLCAAWPTPRAQSQ